MTVSVHRLTTTELDRLQQMTYHRYLAARWVSAASLTCDVAAIPAVVAGWWPWSVALIAAGWVWWQAASHSAGRRLDDLAAIDWERERRAACTLAALDQQVAAFRHYWHDRYRVADVWAVAWDRRLEATP